VKSDSLGTASVSPDNAEASPPQADGAVNSLVAPPSSQDPSPNPVSIVSPPLDETPIATKVPTAAGDRMEAVPTGGASALASPPPPVTSGAAGAAKGSLEGVSENVPAAGATQPTLGDLGAPGDETPPRDSAKDPFANGAPIPPARPTEMDSPGTPSVSLDGAPARPPQSDGAVTPTPSSPLVAAPPTPQFPSPVSIVSLPLDETPIATKVPAAEDRTNAASTGGAPAPLANSGPPVTSDASGAANSSPEGAAASVPASSATQPTLDDLNATQGLPATDLDKGKFADGAPIPPVRPAETGTDDSPGTEKTSVPKSGQLSRHRREVLSPDVVAGTVASAVKDRRSRYHPVRTRANADSASRATKDRRNAVESPPDGPEAPSASGKPGDPLPLIGSVPPPGVGSLEAPAQAPIPAPTQPPTDHPSSSAR